MLSPADMLIIGAVALIAFGPDQLPKVARRAGQMMRDVQNTSQGFIREMERAADEIDMTHETPRVVDSPMYGRMAEATPAYEPFAPDDTTIAPPPSAAPSTVSSATEDEAQASPRRKFSASESS